MSDALMGHNFQNHDLKQNQETVRVAIISITATSDKEKNIEKAFAAAREAVHEGAAWVVLPEMFAYHGPYSDLWQNAEFPDGPLNQRLAAFARDHNIVLFAGSVAERPEGSAKGKVYNTQFIFGRTGNLLAKYRKTHLFNLKDSHGQSLYCESDGYLSGSELVSLKVDGWHIGLATCYDLRFPGVFERLARNGRLDCLIIPAAFTFQTGAYHWELLLRARAVEQLCYVVAPNQVGLHSPGKQSYGHGLIVDPWGTTIADTGHLPGLAIATIKKDCIMACRNQLPALDNRRPELYGL
jgi:predicted amidohydrolase